MFGTYFYHQTSRKMVVAFGTLFNNIEVRRTNSSDVVTEVLKIPLSYGPKDKMLARISSDPSLSSAVALTVPRMGFELTSMTYDGCLLYTSDAADDSLRVDLGGRRIIKKA